MKDFNIEIDGTVTTNTVKKINYLRTLISGESLRDFNELASQVASTTNAHLTFVKKVLLAFFSSTPLPSRSAPCVNLKISL